MIAPTEYAAARQVMVEIVCCELEEYAVQRDAGRSQRAAGLAMGISREAATTYEQTISALLAALKTEATPGATGAAEIRHMKEPCAMPEPTEVFRKAWEVQPGETIVRHPHSPEKTGAWTITAEPVYDGFTTIVFCRDDQGRQGKFDLGPGRFVIVRGTPVLTDQERHQQYADLSADDMGHIAAHLLTHFPRVLDDCLRALDQYPHGTPEVSA